MRFLPIFLAGFGANTAGCAAAGEGKTISDGICLCADATDSSQCPSIADASPEIIQRRGEDCVVSVDALYAQADSGTGMWSCAVCCYDITLKDTPSCQPPGDTG